MGATSFKLDLHTNFSSIQLSKAESNTNTVEEIEGLIRVFKDGHVERPDIVPCVAPSLAPDLHVVAQDIVIDKATSVWARLYVPKCCFGHNHNVPILVYFHGGGFCVGSAAWKCYHEFLGRLASEARCLVVSVDYRLAPENRLPTAYEDGVKVVMWLLKQKQSQHGNDQHVSGLLSKCMKMGNLFLGGDSGGANIAYNVAIRLISCNLIRTLSLKGIVLLQPFFGGEARTNSEKYPTRSSSSSVLNSSISDAYWRLALPSGSNRDHPWCNPIGRGSPIKLGALTRAFPATMVCIAELDMLKDRDLEFCEALAGAGNKVEYVVYKGVGHAFQVLDRSPISQVRTQEMISQITAFIYR